MHAGNLLLNGLGEEGSLRVENYDSLGTTSIHSILILIVMYVCVSRIITHRLATFRMEYVCGLINTDSVFWLTFCAVANANRK